MSEAKKRKKSYYMPAKKQCGGRQLLDVGMKGFLITCNRMEKEATREAYNIFNEYNQLLYGETPPKAESDVKLDETEIDFDKLITSQVEAMQSERSGNNSSAQRQFQAVDTRTTNCIFVRAPAMLDHPDDIVSRVLMDAANSGRTKSRFILKLFPVLGTCRATDDKIEKLVEQIVTERFSTDSLLQTYAIVYKVRCNSLARETILASVGRAVHRACPTSRVDLTHPDYVISIDVLSKFACVSLMKDFYTWKKYNLQEVAKCGTCGGTEAGSTENVKADGMAEAGGSAEANELDSRTVNDGRLSAQDIAGEVEEEPRSAIETVASNPNRVVTLPETCEQ